MMTNDYKDLRIALAEGKCVLDEDGDPVKWFPEDFKYWYEGGWKCLYGAPEFGPNSKVVDDPSLPVSSKVESTPPISNPASVTVQLVYDDETSPPSITYDEALKADKVLIHLPNSYKGLFLIKDEDSWLWFDLAERKGYRMEIVEG
jgi:hypothetical protein